MSKQRLKESTLSQLTISGLSPFHVLITLLKKVHRFVRVDMLADYLVSVSSSVVRQIYYDMKYLLQSMLSMFFIILKTWIKSPLNLLGDW